MHRFDSYRGYSHSSNAGEALTSCFASLLTSFSVIPDPDRKSTSLWLVPSNQIKYRQIVCGFACSVSATISNIRSRAYLFTISVVPRFVFLLNSFSVLGLNAVINFHKVISTMRNKFVTFLLSTSAHMD